MRSRRRERGGGVKKGVRRGGREGRKEGRVGEERGGRVSMKLRVRKGREKTQRKQGRREGILQRQTPLRSRLDRERTGAGWTEQSFSSCCDCEEQSTDGLL